MHSHALVCPVTHISSSEFVRQEFRSREFTDPQEHSIKPLPGLDASATAVRSSVPTLHNRLDESNRTGACIASQPRPHPRAAPFQARSSVRTLKCSRYQAQASPPPTSATHPFATAARCRTPTPVRSSTSRAAGGQSPRATRNCTVRASCCRSGPSPEGVTGENNELAVTHTVLRDACMHFAKTQRAKVQGRCREASATDTGVMGSGLACAHAPQKCRASTSAHGCSFRSQATGRSAWSKPPAARQMHRACTRPARGLWRPA